MTDKITKLEAELFRLGEQQFSHQQQAQQHNEAVQRIELAKIIKSQELQKLRSEVEQTAIDERINSNGQQ